MTPMGVLNFFGRAFLYLVLLTLIGQLRWNGLSLENYYHGAVNSDTFQSGWETATAPFQWVSDRFGLTGEKSQPSRAR